MRSLPLRALVVAFGVSSAVWLGCGADGTTGVEGDNGGGDDSEGGTAPTHPNPNDEDGGTVFLDAGLPGTGGDTDSGGGGTNPDGGGGGTLMCSDPMDPGGSEPVATKLADTNDCDGNGGSIKGVIDGQVDIDMYSVFGADTFGCEINPTATTPSTDIQFCQFLKCRGGGMSFSGCTGGVQAMNDIGMPGCCLSAPGTIVANYNCTGTTNDSVDTFIRVKGLKDACIPYTGTYHF